MNVRTRVVFSSTAPICKSFKVRACQHSTTQPELADSFGKTIFFHYLLVIVSRARSHSGNWPNKILGPIDSVNPKFPLPGAVALYFASKVFKVPLTPAAVIIPKPACERYASILSEVQSVLENEVPATVPVIPSLKTGLLEVKVYACPTILKKGTFQSLKHQPVLDLDLFFPRRDFSRTDLAVITLSRRAQPEASRSPEGHNFVEQFLEAAIDISGSLKEMGYWADFIDPRTGKPFVGFHSNANVAEESRTNRTLSNFSFSIGAVGCCQVLRYPLVSDVKDFLVGTIFTDAPKDHPVLRHLTS
ncbi:hypothetical protein AAHC03_01990 [Spirometra sp. Aus1]